MKWQKCSRGTQAVKEHVQATIEHVLNTQNMMMWNVTFESQFSVSQLNGFTCVVKVFQIGHSL